MIIDMKKVYLPEVDVEDYFKQTAIRFKALCDENRLKIISLLRHNERCSGTLLGELDISQSTLSHHMRILVDSGLVSSRKEGKWTYYTLSEEGAVEARKALDYFLVKDENYGSEAENCCND